MKVQINSNNVIPDLNPNAIIGYSESNNISGDDTFIIPDDLLTEEFLINPFQFTVAIENGVIINLMVI